MGDGGAEPAVAALVDGVAAVLETVRSGCADPAQVLSALASLRVVRERVADWEPELITVARAAGVSWAALAPALGVASRQAAERRYLRLLPTNTGEVTGEARVAARRDQRAGDRAVAQWARQNSASLRILAGQVGALDNLPPGGQRRAAAVTEALDGDDPADLLTPLASTHADLVDDYADLADQVDTVTQHTRQLRQGAAHRSRTGSGGQSRQDDH